MQGASSCCRAGCAQAPGVACRAAARPSTAVAAGCSLRARAVLRQCRGRSHVEVDVCEVPERKQAAQEQHALERVAVLVRCGVAQRGGDGGRRRPRASAAPIGRLAAGLIALRWAARRRDRRHAKPHSLQAAFGPSSPGQQHAPTLTWNVRCCLANDAAGAGLIVGGRQRLRQRLRHDRHPPQLGMRDRPASNALQAHAQRKRSRSAALRPGLPLRERRTLQCLHCCDELGLRSAAPTTEAMASGAAASADDPQSDWRADRPLAGIDRLRHPKRCESLLRPA